MNLHALNPGGTGLELLAGILSIVLIDLILAGDNAVVIAMAVRNLPPRQRRLGILLGAGAAVLLRVGLTFFAARLLDVNFLKIIGGVLISWIAVKLFVEGCPEEGCHRECASVGQAVRTILVADLVMSTDNVLAVAGASKGDLFLLVFGLGLSIPFVVFTSGLLARLMDRFPWFVYLGAAVLGKVAGEMIVTDPWVHGAFAPGPAFQAAAQAAGAAGVILLGRLYIRLSPGPAAQEASPLNGDAPPCRAEDPQPAPETPQPSAHRAS